MGQLYYKDELGNVYPINEVEKVSGHGTIVVRIGVKLALEAERSLSGKLEERLGCPVVLVGPEVEEILQIEQSGGE